MALKLDYYFGRHPNGKYSFYLISYCHRCKFKSICQKSLKSIKNERVFETNSDFYS